MALDKLTKEDILQFLRENKALLKERFHVDKIMLFGSYARDEATDESDIDILIEDIEPRKSHTFRSGKTGGWREYFKDEHKQLFKDVAGNLLVELGYEDSNDW